MFCSHHSIPAMFSDFEDEFSFFTSRGIGLINASPVGMGLLTQSSVPLWHPAPEVTKRACSQAASFCLEKGYSLREYNACVKPKVRFLNS